MAKLAAFDMDGTLLMPDHRLGEKTLSALKRLRERDITLTFATGRHVLEMHHVIGEFSLDAFLITGNGTRIHSLEGEELYRQDLAPEAAEAVLHGKWDTQASMHVFNDGGWFTGQARPELLQAHVFSGFHYQLCDLKRMSAQHVTKICFCGDHDDLRRLRIQLNETLGDRAFLCFSAMDCLEVLPVGCNKGAALAVLSQHLGFTLQECMAFGDAMNDREMLGSVGRGFIMGNAMPQLKAELPHLPVIGDCRNQAVSHFLTHWLDNPDLPYSPNRETLPASQIGFYLAFFIAFRPDRRSPPARAQYRRYRPPPTAGCNSFPGNARRCRTGVSLSSRCDLLRASARPAAIRPHIGAGRGADLAPKLRFQPQGGGYARRIRHAQHLIDNVGNKRRLDARPSYAFNFAADRAAQAGVAGLPVIEEHRILRINDHQLRLVALAANIAANGR